MLFFGRGIGVDGVHPRHRLRLFDRLDIEIDRDRLAVARALTLFDTAEVPPPLEELAATVGYAPHHFNRLFKRATGVTPRLRPILDQFAQGLGQQPGTEVFIVGHVDSTGSDAINNPLSQQRANSVRDYLVSRGADSRIIRTEGRGSREPVASNASESGRAQNRRVEIYVAEPGANG